ncbi:stalk domain-containing protein [Paenibacillus sp. P96]|uniref:Stalk domain-containing protein n=1 Tax=Paenibacillus zeirhizosphaerae TaxID=2987519 RepID=A0ABT9FPE2_9BACL|nr:stalk domain-containing protein [Paenibacillus sp. P96]MDP4096500.1 stalk domain-containing protein [Paenibacillus sp. P96]
MIPFQKKIVRRFAVGLAALSLLLPVLPVAADGELSELRLQTGSTTAVVNGQNIVIAKPYTKNGTMMVPVGVFKKAFNSQIRLEQSDVIKVMSGPHTVILTMGSRTAWVNGQKVKLPSAPEMSGGTLMVPLRFVVEGLGGSLKTGGGGFIVRMEAGAGGAAAEPEVPTIDNDEGKTRVGNSYYNWSMSYPTGLMIGQGGEDESISTFMSEDSTYYMEVHVAPQPVPYDADDLLQQLVQTAKETGETVIDRKAYPDAEVPYARIITKDGDGALWENRQYYDHEQVYVVYLTDSTAVNYKDLAKYSGLLNSFKTSFDTADKTMKDLSTIEGGIRDVYNSDYGIALKIPAGWTGDNSSLLYEGRDGSKLQMTVTSAPQGSVLTDWSAQLQSWLKDSFTASAYEGQKTYPLEVAGTNAIVHEYRYNFGNGWVKEYDVMLQENGYRYLTEYSFPDDDGKGQDQFELLIHSLDIDFSVVSSNFGQLEEDEYLADKTKSDRKISKAYGYTVDIPTYWTPVSERFESADIEYQFLGGSFSIKIDEDQSYEMMVSQLKDFYDGEAKDYTSLKVEEVEDTTIAGVPAVSFTFHQTDNGIGYTGRQILLEHNGATYILSTTLNDANNTASQSLALNSALNSFTFVD